MKKYFFTFLVSVIFPVLLYAQTTVNVASDNPPAIGNLNTAVQAAIDGGTLSNTVFNLELVGYYVLTGAINVPAGQRLTIVAPTPGTTQATAPPQIVWAPTGGLDRTFSFNCYGDLSLKNIWILGATTVGDQVGSCICFQDDPLSTARRCTMENVIIDYVPIAFGGGSVNINCTNFRATFKNCYWKNNTDKHFKYYGRALSFPFSTTGWHGDSVTFENCTFANIGYVLMQEGGEYNDYVKFNHCTFFDVVMYPLESGWWNKLSVTNCIFQNTEMLGYIPSQVGTGDSYGGTLRIDSVATFGFTVPYTEQQRRILFTNSTYALDQWLVDWMGFGPNGNPYSKGLHQQRRDDEVPAPEPMLNTGTIRFFDTVDVASGQKVFPYMNRADLATLDPRFIAPPVDIAKAKDFCWRKWNDNTDTNWAYKPENSINFIWPMDENMAYNNDTVKTAGMGGFPLGDLYRWWPEKYTTWAAQSAAENTRISTWLNTGKDGGTSVSTQMTLPSKYDLSQNYPNPFNPSTQIKYTIPEKSAVTLKIYNILGTEVATLVNGEQQAGEHVVTFDGKEIASGIYFYRLQSGNVSITKKLVLMK